MPPQAAVRVYGVDAGPSQERVDVSSASASVSPALADVRVGTRGRRPATARGSSTSPPSWPAAGPDQYRVCGRGTPTATPCSASAPPSCCGRRACAALGASRTGRRSWRRQRRRRGAEGEEGRRRRRGGALLPGGVIHIWVDKPSRSLESGWIHIYICTYIHISDGSRPPEEYVVHRLSYLAGYCKSVGHPSVTPPPPSTCGGGVIVLSIPAGRRALRGARNQNLQDCIEYIHCDGSSLPPRRSSSSPVVWKDAHIDPYCRLFITSLYAPVPRCTSPHCLQLPPPTQQPWSKMKGKKEKKKRQIWDIMINTSPRFLSFHRLPFTNHHPPNPKSQILP